MAKTKRNIGDTIKVRATAVGFYGDVRRRVGDVFLLYPRTGTFTELVIDDKTKRPMLNEDALVKHRITTEVDDKTLTAEEQFNPKWMVKVAASTPERASTAQETIQEEHDRILKQRLSGGLPAESVPGSGGAPPELGTGDKDVLGE